MKTSSLIPGLMLVIFLPKPGLPADVLSDALGSTGITWSVTEALDTRSSWKAGTLDGEPAVVSVMGPRAVPGTGPFGFIYLGDSSTLAGSFTGPGVVACEYDWRYNTISAPGVLQLQPGNPTRFGTVPVRFFSAFGPGAQTVSFLHTTYDGETNYATSSVKRVRLHTPPGAAADLAMDLPGTVMTATPAGAWVGAGEENATVPGTDRLVLLPGTDRPAELSVTITGPVWLSVDHSMGADGQGWGAWFTGTEAMETIYPGDPGQGLSRRYSFVVPPGPQTVTYRHLGAAGTSMSMDRMTLTPGSVALAEALETPGRVWTSTAGSLFVGIAAANAYSGGDCLAGSSSGGHTGLVSTQVTGPAEVAFAYRGAGRALVDGVEVKQFQNFLNSNIGQLLPDTWSLESILLPAGVHTVSFSATHHAGQYQDLYLDSVSIAELPDPAAVSAALDTPGRTWRTSAGWQMPAAGAAVGGSFLSATAAAGGSVAGQYAELDLQGPLAVTFRYRVTGTDAKLSVNGAGMAAGSGDWQIGTYALPAQETLLRFTTTGPATALMLDGMEIHGLVTQREGMDLAPVHPFTAGGFPMAEAVGGNMAVARFSLTLGESPLPGRWSFRCRAVNGTSGTAVLSVPDSGTSATITPGAAWQTFGFDVPEGRLILSPQGGAELALDDVRFTPGASGNFAASSVFAGLPGSWSQSTTTPWTISGGELRSSGSGQWLTGAITGPASIAAILSPPPGSSSLYATVRLDGVPMETGGFLAGAASLRAFVGPGTHHISFTSNSGFRLSALTITPGIAASGLVPVMGEVSAAGMLGGTLTTEEGRTAITGPATVMRLAEGSMAGFSCTTPHASSQLTLNGQRFAADGPGIWKTGAVYTGGTLAGRLEAAQQLADLHDLPPAAPVPVPGHESWSAAPGAWGPGFTGAIQSRVADAVAETVRSGPGTLFLSPASSSPELEVSINGGRFVRTGECRVCLPSGPQVVRVRYPGNVTYVWEPQLPPQAEALDTDLPFIFTVAPYGSASLESGSGAGNDHLSFNYGGGILFTAPASGIFSIRTRGKSDAGVLPRPAAGWSPLPVPGGTSWRELAIPVPADALVYLTLVQAAGDLEPAAADALRFTPAAPAYLNAVAPGCTAFTGDALHPDGDRDRDGALNSLEYLCGTGLTDAAERSAGPELFPVAGHYQLRCQVHGSLNDSALVLQRSPDLTRWFDISEPVITRVPVAGTPLELRQWLCPSEPDGTCYYRLMRP